MELKGFRELLLKKAEESNSNLKEFISHAKDELIVDRIFESLEKMAQPSAAMGRGANSAITTYAGQLTNSDVAQVKDALAHHISQYRGALKSGSRDVADKHLSKIIPLMHLVGRASKHSGGKLGIDYRSTTPWESNYTTTDRHEHNGKLKEGTKDLGRRPKKTRGDNPRGVPDYRYLEMAPHAGHSETGSQAFPGSGYPFEETQVGSQQDIDAGKGYLHISDPGEVKEYVPHPFDAHPVHEHADHAEHDRTPESKEKFAEDLKNWRNSDSHKQWMANQKEAFTKDPEGYKARGTVKPGHFWDGVKMTDQPDHAKAKPTVTATPSTPSLDIGLDAPEAPAAPAVAEKPAKSKSMEADPGIHKMLLDHSNASALTSMSPAVFKLFQNHANKHMTPEEHSQMHPEVQKRMKV